MKLLLTSHGPLTEEQESELRKLTAKDFQGLKIIYCITASNKDGGDQTWMISNLDRFRDLGFSVDICDIAGADQNNLLSRFEKADILYFEGGDTPWLLQAIKASGIAGHLPELLKTRIWIGVSAGSIVLCPAILASCSEWFNEKPSGFLEGLNLIDFQFLPHLNSHHFPGNTIDNIENVKRNLEKSGSGKLYCVDDYGAVSVNGDDVKFIGNSAAFEL